MRRFGCAQAVGLARTAAIIPQSACPIASRGAWPSGRVGAARPAPLFHGFRAALGRLAAGALLASVSVLASAQGIDAGIRPLRLVVPFPSGPADLLGRLYAQRMAELLGRAVVVENRSGATGTIGADLVAKSAADGNTLLFTVDLPIVMAPALVHTPYDPRKAFAPIALVGETMQLIVVNPALGVRSIDDLVVAARARPEQLTFASAGNASPGHLCGEMLNARLDIRMTHVPYRGAGLASQAVLAGEVSLFCGPITQALPFLPMGRLIGLAVTGDRASPLLPGMPVLAERLPGFIVSNWYGFFAPAGTTPGVLAPIVQALRRIAAEREVRDRLAGMGVDPVFLEAGPLAQRIEVDLARWTRVIGQAGIKAE